MIVVDGRPHMEGKKLLQQLLRSGISASYCLLNALTYVIKVRLPFGHTHLLLALAQDAEMRLCPTSCALAAGIDACLHATTMARTALASGRASLSPACTAVITFQLWPPPQGTAGPLELDCGRELHAIPRDPWEGILNLQYALTAAVNVLHTKPSQGAGCTQRARRTHLVRPYPSSPEINQSINQF